MKSTAEGSVTERPTGFAGTGFARFAWGLLAYNIAVVLWGAYVRATGSGAGCGGHWPLCNGDVVPRAPTAETMIEYTHRLTVGLALVGLILLVVWSRRAFPQGHRARTAAALSFVLFVVESLLGAGLVLFDYVAHNASVGRAFYLMLHLANTQILLAALTTTAWVATRPAAPLWPREAPKVLFAGLALVLAVSMTGAVAALGDTLFPAQSVRAGIQQEFARTANVLLKLRTIHPPLATLAGVFLLYAASSAVRFRPTPAVKRMALALAVAAVVQLCAGAVNIALLAPAWMQLLHLLLADIVWICLVLLTARTAADGVPAARSAVSR